MFEQIKVTQLARIHTLGGDVLHGMRHIDDGFSGFGEAYFSWVEKGAVKAWKRHTKMTMNLIVPLGNVRFVFVADDRKEIREEILGVTRYVRLTVPPGLWFGFQGLAEAGSLVLNIANIMHQPDEVERCQTAEIDYNWNS